MINILINDWIIIFVFPMLISLISKLLKGKTLFNEFISFDFYQIIIGYNLILIINSNSNRIHQAILIYSILSILISLLIMTLYKRYISEKYEAFSLFSIFIKFEIKENIKYNGYTNKSNFWYIQILQLLFIFMNLLLLGLNVFISIMTFK